MQQPGQLGLLLCSLRLRGRGRGGEGVEVFAHPLGSDAEESCSAASFESRSRDQVLWDLMESSEVVEGRGVQVVYGWCRGGLEVVYGWCTRGVRRCCTGGVEVVYGWCTGGRGGLEVVYGWCRGGLEGWCTGGVRVVYGWCTGGVEVVYGWCRGGVRVVYGWCTGGVEVVYGWCTGGLEVVYRASIRSVSLLRASLSLSSLLCASLSLSSSPWYSSFFLCSVSASSASSWCLFLLCSSSACSLSSRSARHLSFMSQAFSLFLFSSWCAACCFCGDIVILVILSRCIISKKKSLMNIVVKGYLQGGRLLALPLQTPVFLLLDEGGGPGGGSGGEGGRRRVSGRVGHQPLVQGLPLVLDEGVLLHHHSLEGGQEGLGWIG
ncbi:hypothetical protein F7725_022204 [Dissostichus mawsoni]|uniref:Uncharacterized protein n=1 Tax=Dissostichus mawsoni TaxID=36200 RepID=A0A7J5YZC6_DISMA|nr:hypothetical protein F7725_022204 [Dissostichus mawsoni]